VERREARDAEEADQVDEAHRQGRAEQQQRAARHHHLGPQRAAQQRVHPAPDLRKVADARLREKLVVDGQVEMRQLVDVEQAEQQPASPGSNLLITRQRRARSGVVHGTCRTVESVRETAGSMPCRSQGRFKCTGGM